MRKYFEHLFEEKEKMTLCWKLETTQKFTTEKFHCTRIQSTIKLTFLETALVKDHFDIGWTLNIIPRVFVVNSRLEATARSFMATGGDGVGWKREGWRRDRRRQNPPDKPGPIRIKTEHVPARRLMKFTVTGAAVPEVRPLPSKIVEQTAERVTIERGRIIDSAVALRFNKSPAVRQDAREVETRRPDSEPELPEREVERRCDPAKSKAGMFEML